MGAAAAAGDTYGAVVAAIVLFEDFGWRTLVAAGAAVAVGAAVAGFTFALGLLAWEQGGCWRVVGHGSGTTFGGQTAWWEVGHGDVDFVGSWEICW